MGSLNHVTLLGRVGKNPESRFFSDGTQVVNFSLATSEVWKDKTSGERKEKTSWHNITAMRGVAKVCADYVTKGSELLVVGKIQYREWEDKEGNKRYATEIFADNVQLIGGKQGGAKPQQKQIDEGGDIPF